MRENTEKFTKKLEEMFKKNKINQKIRNCEKLLKILRKIKKTA